MLPKTPAEEAAPVDDAVLWARVSHGERSDAADARQELIERHRAYAKVFAATCYGRRFDDEIDFDDYRQWALLGLVEAVDRFDPERGVQFKTFASRWMHGRVVNGIESATEKQRQIATRRRLREERVAALASADGATADVFAVLAEIGIGVALGFMLEGTGMVDEGPHAMSSDHGYARVELAQLRARVRGAVERLSEQEQNVVRRHYVDEELFSDIARAMKLTKGRISQIHRQALGKLRLLIADSDRLDLAL